MPETPDIDTDKLREAVQEELGREGGGFLRRIALTTAVLAAVAAVGALKAGRTAKEGLGLENEATRGQAGDPAPRGGGRGPWGGRVEISVGAGAFKKKKK